MRGAVAALAAAIALLSSACSQQVGRPATAAVTPRAKPVWAFKNSDIPVDPGYRFSQLPNGMRLIVRQNATPKGTAQVRMQIDAGSLDERDDERGFAHFVEHMAFNGSGRVPEGEMVRLLERHGLAFGADTNAQTNFEQTLYMLDLPRNDPALLDTALMLMRETASNLTFAAEAVDRERGVILSERRDRQTYQMRNLVDQLAFQAPQALYPQRLPIGTVESITGATAPALKQFWSRNYVPSKVTIIVVGDFDASLVEAKIAASFADWPTAATAEQPSPGPVNLKARGQTDIFIDPALSERVTASRDGPWLDEPDTVSQRRENLLRQIGYGIVNRRFQRMVRSVDPPFRDAGFGTGDTFHISRTTNLIVDVSDGKWRRGLAAATASYRRALKFGFSKAEVDEQVATILSASQDAAASASTRGNGSLVGAALQLIRDDRVPSTPESSLSRLEAFIPQITPKRVLAAMEREAIPLADPMIRFQGRTQPDGGEVAIRSVWNAGMTSLLRKEASSSAQAFAYTYFGPAGAVNSDVREPQLGIRTVQFANGVRLNLKRTDLAKEQVSVRLSLDGGELLDTRDNPLATEMAPVLPVGGLGKHSNDALQSLLAGHTVGLSLSTNGDVFSLGAQTTPRDLLLQLQLLTAAIADPGYRPEGEAQYRLNIANFFARLDATPASALSAKIGGILSDDDPRFTLQSPATYQALTFAGLRQSIGDRLAHGAIEIGIVGDVDEDQAIAMVAATLGALQQREPEFLPYADRRARPFTNRREPAILRHGGDADQALLRLTWLTRDDSDPAAAIALELLQRVVQINITDTLREKLGETYSPGVGSNLSGTWKDYGTFSITASVKTADLENTRNAVTQVLAALQATPPSDDIVLRARQPMVEAIQNGLKSNAGWLSLADRAQSKPEHIDRFIKALSRLNALTARDIQQLARQYLTPERAVTVLVLPRTDKSSGQ